jgi:hypothetical protein
MASITRQELDAIVAANEKFNNLKLQLKIAELEANNTVLQIYCNYGLKPGIDNILATGEIEYHQQKLQMEEE